MEDLRRIFCALIRIVRAIIRTWVLALEAVARQTLRGHIAYAAVPSSRIRGSCHHFADDKPHCLSSIGDSRLHRRVLNKAPPREELQIDRYQLGTHHEPTGTLTLHRDTRATSRQRENNACQFPGRATGPCPTGTCSERDIAQPGTRTSSYCKGRRHFTDGNVAVSHPAMTHAVASRVKLHTGRGCKPTVSAPSFHGRQ